MAKNIDDDETPRQPIKKRGTCTTQSKARRQWEQRQKRADKRRRQRDRKLRREVLARFRASDSGKGSRAA